MSAASGRRPRLLVVGGCGGLVGRAVLGEFARDWSIRSLHRHVSPGEAMAGVEWVVGDAGTVADWMPLLREVDTIVNLAWYRTGSLRRFRPLADGLRRLIDAAERAGTRRFVHVSVPAAPPSLESGLPYLSLKREVDRALAASGLAYAIVRPTMLFGPGDKLLTVMLRTAARYHRLPIFATGGYHLSPLSARDLARILRREGEAGARRTVDAGGPRRWTYLELTERIFSALRRPPRYLHLSGPNGIRLARLLERLGSSLLYAYEVEWLLSDELGLPSYEGLPTPLEPVEPFLDAEASRLRRGRAAPQTTG
jgi:uncharacterized protein YbjT (DUF2867 family)